MIYSSVADSAFHGAEGSCGLAFYGTTRHWLYAPASDQRDSWMAREESISNIIHNLPNENLENGAPTSHNLLLVDFVDHGGIRLAVNNIERDRYHSVRAVSQRVCGLAVRSA